jgi:hypothetical protein
VASSPGDPLKVNADVTRQAQRRSDTWPRREMERMQQGALALAPARSAHATGNTRIGSRQERASNRGHSHWIASGARLL